MELNPPPTHPGPQNDRPAARALVAALARFALHLKIVIKWQMFPSLPSCLAGWLLGLPRLRVERP